LEGRTRAKAAARWDIDDPRLSPSIRSKRLGRARTLRRLSYRLARLFRGVMRNLMMIPKRKDTAQGRVLMSYYRALRDGVVALDKAGLLVKIDEQINKDI